MLYNEILNSRNIRTGDLIRPCQLRRLWPWHLFIWAFINHVLPVWSSPVLDQIKRKMQPLSYPLCILVVLQRSARAISSTHRVIIGNTHQLTAGGNFMVLDYERKAEYTKPTCARTDPHRFNQDFNLFLWGNNTSALGKVSLSQISIWSRYSQIHWQNKNNFTSANQIKSFERYRLKSFSSSSKLFWSPWSPWVDMDRPKIKTWTHYSVSFECFSPHILIFHSNSRVNFTDILSSFINRI